MRVNLNAPQYRRKPFNLTKSFFHLCIEKKKSSSILYQGHGNAWNTMTELTAIIGLATACKTRVGGPKYASPRGFSDRNSGSQIGVHFFFLIDRFKY